MDTSLIYKGERIFPDGGSEVRGNPMVTVNDKVLEPVRDWWGENEFEWGCSGTSASNNLAMAILYDFWGKTDVPNYIWIPFRKKFIENFEFDTWVLEEKEISNWLQELMETL